MNCTGSALLDSLTKESDNIKISGNCLYRGDGWWAQQSIGKCSRTGMAWGPVQGCMESQAAFQPSIPEDACVVFRSSFRLDKPPSWLPISHRHLSLTFISSSMLLSSVLMSCFIEAVRQPTLPTAFLGPPTPQPALISVSYLHGAFPHLLQVFVQMSPRHNPDHPRQTAPLTLPCFLTVTLVDIYFSFSFCYCPSSPTRRKALRGHGFCLVHCYFP